MAADRRIDAHRGLTIADVPLQLAKLGVQLLAHAVQPLELEFRPVRQRLDLADRVRVVRREGRIDDIAGGEQLAGAGQVGDVGRDLARPHRVIGQPADLGELDLGIPIGPFDQAHHQLAALRPGSVDHPVAQGCGALLIGLDRDPEPLPTVGEQRIVGEQSFEHVHLQLETVGFLGVDGEMDVRPRRLQRQFADHRDHRGDGLGLVSIFEARVKRGQLDRNAGRFPVPAPGFLPDPVERIRISLGVTLGIGERLGRFTEHVEAVAEPLALLRLGALQCFVDGPPEHEVAAEDLHRLAHGGADHRLTQAPDRAPKRRLPIIRAVGRPLQHLAG